MDVLFDTPQFQSIKHFFSHAEKFSSKKFHTINNVSIFWYKKSAFIYRIWHGNCTCGLFEVLLYYNLH